MRVLVVHETTCLRGGAEHYLADALPLLTGAGFEVATLCETDDPNGEPAFGTGLLRWSTAELGERAALAAARAWRPDVVWTHLVASPAVERAVTAIAPAVKFAHGYLGVCLSGSRCHTRPTTEVCDRTFGWSCLVHCPLRGCGGGNPVRMVREFERQRQRGEVLRRHRAIIAPAERVADVYRRHAPGVPVTVVPHLVTGTAGSADPPHGEPLGCHGLTPEADSHAKQESPGTWLSGSAVKPCHPQGGAGTNSRRIVFAGRMHDWKGGRVLLDALPFVARDLPNITVRFIGDGPARADWERTANGVSKRTGIGIEFEGWRERAEMAGVWRESDLLVVPSVWPEPFGLVGPEAGRFGVPAAAFDVGGIPAWLTEGENGHLATPGDPQSLAAAIVRCLGDAAHHERLRQGAIRLSRRFEPGPHVAALRTVLEGVATRDHESKEVA